MNKSLIAIMSGAAAVLGLASCQNQEQVFPDFDYQTIYFATQAPVQSITLGEDGEYDVTWDNEHRFVIYATMGGVNSNKKNRWADYVIDNSLVEGIEFADGTPVKALPSTHYQITSDPNRIFINKGNVMGGIDIKLTDAFFADPEAVNVCYVIPVRLTQGSDSILSGELKEGFEANILDASVWDVQPRNFTLYGIKYKNQWHGTWLSRGEVTKDGVTTKHEDPQGWWEKEEVHYLTSKSLNSCHYVQTNAVSITNADGTIGEANPEVDVILNIANDGTISFSTETEGATVTGSGKYTYHGAGNAWGALERDKMELEFTYTVPYVSNLATNEVKTLTVSVKETLVSRDRQSKYETFEYVIK